MRFLSILALVALPTAALAKDKKAETTFSKYFSQSLSATPIKLEDSSFNELTASPRDYAAIVLLTAMPAQFGCQLCRQFQPEWDVLSKSWNRGDRKGNSRVIFGTLDFPDGKGTFQKVCHVLESLGNL